MTNSRRGSAVTRLLGRLKVVHRDGLVEFELRSPAEMKKRGAKVLLHIENLGEIPLLEDGTVIVITAVQARFERTNEATEDVPVDRRGNRS